MTIKMKSSRKVMFPQRMGKYILVYNCLSSFDHEQVTEAKESHLFFFEIEFILFPKAEILLRKKFK
jgi:hypothetical protein